MRCTLACHPRIHLVFGEIVPCREEVPLGDGAISARVSYCEGGPGFEEAAYVSV